MGTKASLERILSLDFNFSYVCVYVCMLGSTRACRGQSKVLGPLELELRVVVNLQVPGTELSSFTRQRGALSHWPVSPALTSSLKQELRYILPCERTLILLHSTSGEVFLI